MPSNPEPTEGTFKETGENLNVRENVQVPLTAPEPTQPLTGDEESLIREWHNKTRDPKLGRVLAEVDRLRHENEYHQRYRYTAEQNAHDTARENRTLRDRIDKVSAIGPRDREVYRTAAGRSEANGWNDAIAEVRTVLAMDKIRLALDQSGEGQANADR